jgi:hypothetical protein
MKAEAMEMSSGDFLDESNRIEADHERDHVFLQPEDHNQGHIGKTEHERWKEP